MWIYENLIRVSSNMNHFKISLPIATHKLNPFNFNPKISFCNIETIHLNKTLSPRSPVKLSNLSPNKIRTQKPILTPYR